MRILKGLGGAAVLLLASAGVVKATTLGPIVGLFTCAVGLLFGAAVVATYQALNDTGDQDRGSR